MSLSVGRVGGVSYTAPVSNSFKVDNRSEVSDDYKVRSDAAMRTGAVEPVHPVQYATATQQTQSSGKRDNSEVEKAFNDMAKNFQGISGYDSRMGGTNYAVVGSQFDAIA